MKKPEILERDNGDGTTTIWYSKEYHNRELQNQADIAFQNGIIKGINVQFYALEPCNKEAVDKLIVLFKEEVNKLYRGVSKDMCQTCINNKPGIESGLFCINNCIAGSKYQPKDV